MSASPPPFRWSPRAARARWALLLAWLLALVASTLVMEQAQQRHDATLALAPLDDAHPPARLHQAMLPAFDASGQPAGEVRVVWRHWPAQAAPAHASPAVRHAVVFLHGSPGDGSNFARLAPLLAQGGHDVYALDLPGFGLSGVRPPSHANTAHARVVRAWMERALAPGARAHMVGWSNGGGTALHLAQFSPEVVASLTLLGSIGMQQYEGSGVYALEHAKYRTGWVLLRGFDLVPHFGLLGLPDQRLGWLRNFMQTDQRLMAGALDVVARTGTPVLVLHGKHDVLVRLRAAEASFERLGPAGPRLVVLHANHFIPFLQAPRAAEVLGAFFARVEGAPTAHADARSNFALPAPGGMWIEAQAAQDVRTGVLGWLDAARARVGGWPWWVHALVLALVYAWAPWLGMVLAVLPIVGQTGPDVDPFVALLGLLAGSAVRVVAGLRGSMGVRAKLRSDALGRMDPALFGPVGAGLASGLMHAPRERVLAGALLSVVHRPGGALLMLLAGAGGVFLAMAGGLVLAGVLVGVADNALAPRWGAWVLLPALALAGWAAVRWPALVLPSGWRRARAAWTRLRRFEYWPTWLVYASIAPTLVRLALRHRSLSLWSAANPALPAAGGFVGESKAAILSLFAPDARVLAWTALPSGSPAQRGEALSRWMRDAGVEYPVILKPDVGERGHAVRLAPDAGGAIDALAQLAPGAGVVAQRFHPGPVEAGVLWVRTRDRGGEPIAPVRALLARCAGERPTLIAGDGVVLSITGKVFPRVVGDGRRTLEELIERDARASCQREVFERRWLGSLTRVPGLGEVVALGNAGNHAQGTMFVDATASLGTPALARAIGELTDRVEGADWLRFDLRARSEEDLREGRTIGIVEVNGSSGEDTIIYDPALPVRAARARLALQWALLSELGSHRVRASGGAGPRPSLAGVLRTIGAGLAMRSARGGASVAD